MKKITGKLFIISGPSGVGKGTLLGKFLNENPNVKLSISVTTRPPRRAEKNGVDYFFVTEEEFKKSIKNKDFLEWAKYSDYYYGTKIEYVDKKLKDGSNLILEIDTQGAFQVLKIMPNAVSIFILPPSIIELEKRLRNRNTETEDAILKRLKFVQNELKNSSKFKYIITNDNFDDAYNNFTNIFKSESQNIG